MSWIEMIAYALANDFKFTIVKGEYVEEAEGDQEEMCETFKWAKNAEVVVKKEGIICGAFTIELGKNNSPIDVKGSDEFVKGWNEWTPQ